MPRLQDAVIADIDGQMNGERPAAVCIDTLNRSLEGSESSDEDMSAYIRAGDAVGGAFDCLVIIVHHCGHNGERPRGHSSLIGALDVQISVKKDSDANVVAELELAKDGEIGLRFLSRLRKVEIGEDEDGEPLTSCVVDPITDPVALGKSGRKAKSERLPNSARIALRALSKALAEASEPAPASNTIPANVRVVTLSMWKTTAYQLGISSAEGDDAKRKAFDRAHERLLADGLIGSWTDYRWLP
jgi:hypothetical protein